MGAEQWIHYFRGVPLGQVSAEGGQLVYQPWKGQQESFRPFRAWESALLELMGPEPFPQQRFPAVEGFVPLAPGVSCW